MKRSQVFPSTYLSKDDVPHPTRATIADIRMETIKGDGGEEEKAVMHFSEKHLKPMILNNTNWTTLEEVYGDDSDYWRTKPVEIYVDPGVMFGGKRVGGVRVRVPSPNGAPQVSFWTLEQAIAQCANVGITKDDLIGHLRSKGNTSYVPNRDTVTVQTLIASKSVQVVQEQSFDSDPLPAPPAGRDDNQIPF